MSNVTRNKKRIAVLGIGAVGGYFGGLLAGKYNRSNEGEIIFMARGKNKKVIRENGLKIISNETEIIVHPDLVSDDPTEIGKVDFLLCTTKSYDLAESLNAYKECIDDTTVILPLQNGIDAPEIIKAIFPHNEIWEGCVYIVARITEPGVITVTGNIHYLSFGSASADPKKLNWLKNILCDANVDARLEEDIEKIIWEKFLFIAPAASLTSYYDLPIGKILSDPSKREVLSNMLNELKQIGEKKEVNFSEGIIKKTFRLMESLPPGTTSSMHSDFTRNHRSEYLSLTGYVITLGKKYSVYTPEFGRVFESLKLKSTLL